MNNFRIQSFVPFITTCLFIEFTPLIVTVKLFSKGCIEIYFENQYTKRPWNLGSYHFHLYTLYQPSNNPLVRFQNKNLMQSNSNSKRKKKKVKTIFFNYNNNSNSIKTTSISIFLNELFIKVSHILILLTIGKDESERTNCVSPNKIFHILCSLKFIVTVEFLSITFFFFKEHFNICNNIKL